MGIESVLGLLGIALRGSHLALGEQPVADAVASKKARVVLVAQDAAAGSQKRAQTLCQRYGVTMVVIPCSKEQFGASLGRVSLAICAVTDMGLAAAAVKGLAQDDTTLQPIAQAFAEKQTRMQTRKGKKKNRTDKQTKKTVEGEATDSMTK